MSEKESEDVELDLNWDDALAEWEQELDDAARAESRPMPQRSDIPVPTPGAAPPRPLYRPPSQPPAPRPQKEYNVSIEEDDDEEGATRIASLPKGLLDSLSGQDAEATAKAPSRDEHDRPTMQPPPGPLAGLDLDLDDLLDNMTGDASAKAEDPFGGLLPLEEDETATEPRREAARVATTIDEPGKEPVPGNPPRPARPLPRPAAPKVGAPGAKVAPPPPSKGLYRPPPPPPAAKLGAVKKPPPLPPRPSLAGKKSLEESGKTPAPDAETKRAVAKPPPPLPRKPALPLPPPLPKKPETAIGEPPAQPVVEPPAPKAVVEEPAAAKTPAGIDLDLDLEFPELADAPAIGLAPEPAPAEPPREPATEPRPAAPSVTEDSFVAELAPPSEPPSQREAPATRRTPSAAPGDRGAQAAARTVKYRKPREEHFALVGRSQETLRQRRELLRALADKQSGARRARLLVAAAELSEQLGDADEARTLYADARAADARDPIVLRALRRDAMLRGDHGEVAALLEAEAGLALSVSDRAGAYTLLAEIQLRQLGDAAAAEKSARTALGLRRGSVVAALLLAETQLAQRKTAEACTALERAGEAWSDESGRAALLVDVGRTLEQLGFTQRALEKYRAAVAADGTAFDAWIGLARTARGSGDVEAATQALLSLASQLGDGPIAEGLRRLAARWSHVLLDRPADAVALLDGARGALSHVARASAAAAIGDRAARMQSIEAWAQATGTTERALALVTLAELRAEDGDLDGADAALRDAALADNSLGIVQVVRELLARKAGDTARLARAVDMMSEGPGASIAAAARIAADPKADARERDLLAAAAQEGESVLAADVVGLDIAARAGDEDAARAALRRQAERASPENKVGPLLCLADEAAARDDLDAARALLAEAHDVSPGDPLVLRPLGRLMSAAEPREAAAPWLEEGAAATDDRAAHAALQAGRMLARGGADPSPAFRRALDASPQYLPAAWALEPILRESADLAALADLHERIAELSTGSVERAGRLVRAALLRAADDPPAAAALLDKARGVAPDDAILYELMLRLGDGMSPAERAALLVQSAENAPPDIARSARLRGAAAFELAGDAAQAASLYRQVLAEASSDAIAARALDRAELAAGEHARVADRRFSAVKEAQSDEARVHALERMADLDLSERNDVASATLSLQSILEVAPGHVPSLRALERHFMDDRRDADLVRVEELLAEHVAPGPDVLAHARMATRLLLLPEEAPGEAADDVLLSASDRAPFDLWLARRVIGAAAARNDTTHLGLAARAMVALLDGPQEKVEASLRAAEALEATGALREAASVLGGTFEDAPDHPTGAEELGRLREQLGDALGAAEALEAAARVARVPRRAAALWHRAAVLWQDRLDEPDRALDALRTAGELAPTYLDVFERLKRLLIQKGELRQLADLTERRLREGGEPQVLVELHVTLAEMREELGARSSAKESLRAALALDPERLDALRRLADISLHDEDWRGAAEALIKIARLRKDRDELRWVFYTLGDIYDTHMPDPRRAEAAFQRVLKLIPDDTEAMERLADLYRRDGNTAAAAEMLQKLAEHEVDPDRNRDYQIRLASSLESQGDVRQAEAVLEQTRKKAPTDLVVLRALADFYQRQNAQSALAMHSSRAITEFRHALARDPSDPDVWPGLAAVLSWRGQHDAARCIASSAYAVGVASVELSKYIDARGAVPGAGSAAADRALDDLLAPPALTRACRDLFRLAGDALDKALPFDMRAFRADKVPREHAFRTAQLEVGRWFGAADMQIFQTYQAPRVCVAVSTSPVTVLVGGELFTATDDAEKVFLLARAVKVATSDMAVAVRSQPHHLALAIAGLIRSYVPQYAAAGLDSAHVDEMAHRVAKHVHRRVRDELHAIVTELAGSPGFDPAMLGLSASELGDRAALLATGSVPAAIDSLLALAGTARLDRVPSTRIPAIRQVPEAWSLLEWSVSDACFEVRSRVGADRA